MIRSARLASPRYACCTMLCALSLGLFASAGAVHAQSPQPGAASAVIYPARGQSPVQQDRDRYECYDWARRQTGFDPAQPVPSAAPGQPPPAQTPSGAIVRGAATGAAVGELVRHDPGRGAAAGALGGVMRERARERQAAQAQQQQAAQQQVVRSQQHATYERAVGACMEGRGYTVR